jgi:sugar-specific transcriptional regulator TrmB
MNPNRDLENLLGELELKEYEVKALAHLLRAGRTTAPDIAEATDTTQARIYGVLESLADGGSMEALPE